MNQKKNIWLWGCNGTETVIIPWILEHTSYCVKGLIDNDEKKHGKKMHGFSVMSFQEAKTHFQTDDILLCTCRLLSTFEKMKGEAKRIKHPVALHYSEWGISSPVTVSEEPSSWVTEKGCDERFVSKCCTQEEFYKDWFVEFAKNLRRYHAHDYDRHLWEWVYTIKVIQESDFLHEGCRGVGFAVGKEPLPSFFAGKGIDIVATDLSLNDANAKNWYDNNANPGGKLNNVYCPDICRKEDFYSHVTYRDVNMNTLPEDLGVYDFCWSICAIEHLGSLEKSKSFLKNMVKFLKPSGVAIHTTEFNLTSDLDTIESGGTVLFRKKDIEEMKNWFLSHGCLMETSFCKGELKGNFMVDEPPYLYRQDETGNRFSLALLHENYIHTSYAIVIRKLKS